MVSKYWGGPGPPGPPSSAGPENISFSPLLSRVRGHYGYQKKRNSSGKSIFLVWCAIFHSKLRKLQKTLKIGQNRWKTAIFQWFFEVCSILTEKQRTKPKILSFLKNFASFGTSVAPKLAIIVELFQVLCFVSKFCEESALWWFSSFFQNEAWYHLNWFECH